MSNADQLRTLGLKTTSHRLKIIELFEMCARGGLSGRRHLTAEDVHQLLYAGDASVGLATVYRTLNQFEQAGLLTQHHFDSGKAVYELNEGGHHDHLVCLQCGKVLEFQDAEIEERQAEIARLNGFAIRDHALTIYADCINSACPNLRARTDSKGFQKKP